MAIWALIVSLLVLGAAKLLLDPTTSNSDFNLAQAKQFLGEHRGELDHLVQLVENCQPTGGDGGRDIVESRPEEHARPVRCAAGPQSGVQKIREALSELNLVASSSEQPATSDVAPTADDDPTVSIVTAESGLMVAGHVTRLNYHLKARERADYVDAGPDGRVYSEERALTPPPHHWCWEQTN
ncbi:hypothetical protein [Phenylobacterium aquaticum]|uniref:hypothetical protein n=1 Tax=Phenylobacterium aquaticum TaxID=1763816 RepID=UPI0026ED3616|nr:hypothetical protein [Phenylobacterium aquaticum]